MTSSIKSIFVFSSFLFSLNALAQFRSTPALISKAEVGYRLSQYADAANYYTQALEKGFGPKSELIKKIADCHWMIKNYDQALFWYEKIEKTEQANEELVKYRLGELKAIHGQYDEAVRLLSTVKGMEVRTNGFRNPNQFLVDSADWRLSFLDINTGTYNEYSPLFIRKKLAWTTNLPKNLGESGIMGWDGYGYSRQVYLASAALANPVDPQVYYAYPPKEDSLPQRRIAKNFAKSDNAILKSTPLPENIVLRNKLKLYTPSELEGVEQIDYNIGHATFSSALGKIYFSANDQGKLLDGEFRNVSIVEGRFTDEGRVENIRFLKLGKHGETVMHPAIHPGGDLLVYSSNRPGGKGGFDLYVVEKINDSSWSAPKPLEMLNSNGNELFATFAPNGDLYFSSDGLPGLGGLDIYSIAWSSVGLSVPDHLSFPVNSSYDDFGWAQNEDGSAGYFSSNRLGTDDIMGVTFSPRYVNLLGTVVHRQTGLRTADVKVTLFSKDPTGNLVEIKSLKTDKNGNYSFEARPNKNYQVQVYDPELLNQTQYVEVNTSSVLSNMDLEVVQVGKLKSLVSETPQPDKARIVADSVYFILYFGFDKYELSQANINELDRASRFLSENKGYTFKLLGHTDLKGRSRYNMKLSSKRVQGAINYLISKGYSSHDFTIGHYGEQVPVSNGLDDLSGLKNRRVEIVVIPAK